MPAWPNENEVHLWCIGLDQPAEQAQASAAVLSPDELERASRFVFERDRLRYVVGRGALRRVLGGYLSVLPHLVQFQYAARGKPALAIANSALKFNLAHSGELALLAVAATRELGVDLELVRPLDTDADAVARRFFSPEERVRISAESGADRDRLFLKYWTRKEATFKLTGHGLSHALDRFDVSWLGNTSALLRIEDASGGAWQLSVQDVDAARDYAAAVAVEGEGWCVVWQPYASVLE